MHRTPLVAVALAAAVLVTGCDDKPTTSAPAAPASATAPAKPAIDYSAWAAGKSTPVADPIYPKHGNPGLDVLHYGLDLSWAPATTTLTGTATLQVRPVKDAATLTLDFKPYTLNGVTVDGVPADAAIQNEKLVVQ